jgi:signal peptidase I
MRKKIIYIALFIFVLIMLRIFLFEIYVINQNSMKNTYKTGDRVLILKNFYSIKHNDVLIFKHDNENLIKRCVGLSGESLKIINGNIYSNNVLISPPPKGILKNKPESEIDVFTKSDIYFTFGTNWTLNNFGSYLIPNDYFFLVGDNRAESIDSRIFGAIKKSDIKGKVILRF